MSDFENVQIEIRYATSAWGPYLFDLSRMIPTGTSVSAVTVRAFSGLVRATDDIANFTEITALLVDPGAVVVNSIVSQFFTYPGDLYKGTRATIIFEVTLDNAGVHPYYYPYLFIN
jgi:hypothetical protein